MTNLDKAFLRAYSKVGDANSTPPAATRIDASHASAPTPAAEPAIEPVAEAPPQQPKPRVAPFLPAFQVDKFQWPDVAVRLSSEIGVELRRFAEEIIVARPTGGLWMVAGATRGDGCSTTLLTMARAFASLNRRVAIIDADFTGGRLAAHLGIRVVTGWERAICGEVPLQEALIESTDDQMTLAPLGAHLADPAELEGCLSLAECIQQLASHYDITLLDAGPIAAGTSSAEIIAPLAADALEGALVVRDARRTSAMEVEAAGSRLLAAGVARWNVAENFTQPAHIERAGPHIRSSNVRSLLATP